MFKRKLLFYFFCFVLSGGSIFCSNAEFEAFNRDRVKEIRVKFNIEIQIMNKGIKDLDRLQADMQKGGIEFISISQDNRGNRILIATMSNGTQKNIVADEFLSAFSFIYGVKQGCPYTKLFSIQEPSSEVGVREDFLRKKDYLEAEKNRILSLFSADSV